MYLLLLNTYLLVREISEASKCSLYINEQKIKYVIIGRRSKVSPTRRVYINETP